MELGVDQDLMDIIEHDYPNDCRRCCLDMFDSWLDRNPVASWEDVTVAIDSLSSFGTT